MLWVWFGGRRFGRGGWGKGEGGRGKGDFLLWWEVSVLVGGFLFWWEAFCSGGRLSVDGTQLDGVGGAGSLPAESEGEVAGEGERKQSGGVGYVRSGETAREDRCV